MSSERVHRLVLRISIHPCSPTPQFSIHLIAMCVDVWCAIECGVDALVQQHVQHATHIGIGVGQTHGQLLAQREHVQLQLMKDRRIQTLATTNSKNKQKSAHEHSMKTSR